jgi:hypothetical protein
MTRRRRTVELSAEQRRELEAAVVGHHLMYVRERAAAILKVADGMPAQAVAAHGLLVKREPDTVYAWLNRYAADGLAGLVNRPGRGRKPAFSPSAPKRSGGA